METGKAYSESLATLIRQAAVFKGNDKAEYNRRILAIANRVADVREAYDISGRTYAYRVIIQDAYSLAGVTEDVRKGIAAAVRYHVSTVMRERGLVEEYWLKESARERSMQRRAARRSIARSELASMAEEVSKVRALLADSAAVSRLADIESRLNDYAMN